MSRIAFFTERLPPDTDPISVFSYDLMCGLAEQQHELRVFSTYLQSAQLPPTRPRIEILRPFRRWNWLELPRTLPLLFEFQPDILHLIQPREEAVSGFTNAMSAISNFAPLMGRPAIVTSFYDLKKEDLQKQKSLLLSSHVVTVTTQPQIELMKDFYNKTTHRPLLSILPIPDGSHGAEAVSPSWASGEINLMEEMDLDFQPLQTFLNQRRKVILIPGEIDQQREVDTLFRSMTGLLEKFRDAAIVFAGGWGRMLPRERHRLMANFDASGVGSRVYIAGRLSASARRQCLKQSQAVLVAGLPIESLTLTEIIRESLSCLAPLIMTTEQAELGYAQWKDRENVLLISAAASVGRDEWTQKLNLALQTVLDSPQLIELIRSQLPEFARSEVQDKPGNVMSRIYAEALSRKRPVR